MTAKSLEFFHVQKSATRTAMEEAAEFFRTKSPIIEACERIKAMSIDAQVRGIKEEHMRFLESIRGTRRF